MSGPPKRVKSRTGQRTPPSLRLFLAADPPSVERPLGEIPESARDIRFWPNTAGRTSGSGCTPGASVPKAEGDGAVQAWIDPLPDWQSARARRVARSAPGASRRHRPKGTAGKGERSNATKSKSRPAAATPALLAGGNPQIAKADGDAPMQAYIAAMPGWKRDVGRRLDALIGSTVPNVRKAVRWNSPFYGMEGQGWFLNFHCFTKYVKVAFFRGTSLRPLPPASPSTRTRATSTSTRTTSSTSPRRAGH
jgi:hypothetical protein